MLAAEVADQGHPAAKQRGLSVAIYESAAAIDREFQLWGSNPMTALNQQNGAGDVTLLRVDGKAPGPAIRAREANVPPFREHTPRDRPF